MISTLIHLGLMVLKVYIGYFEPGLVERNLQYIFCFEDKSKLFQKDCFELLSATSQEWIAGVRGDGRGVKYVVRLRITTYKSIEFDSMWVNGKRMKLKVVELLQGSKSILSKNDTINLVASYYSEDSKIGSKEKEESLNKTSIVPPIEYKGAALIKYSKADSIKYHEIPVFVVLPKIIGQ